MMGQQSGGQKRLFYAFNLDDHVLKFFPADAPADPSENLKAMTARMQTMVQEDADALGLGVEVLGFTVGGMHPPVPVAPWDRQMLARLPGCLDNSPAGLFRLGEHLLNRIEFRLWAAVREASRRHSEWPGAPHGPCGCQKVSMMTMSPGLSVGTRNCSIEI